MAREQHERLIAEIRQALDARGVTASRAALEAGLPRRAIQNVLDGHKPSSVRVAEVCAALGLEYYVGPPRQSVDRGTDRSVPRSGALVVREPRGTYALAERPPRTMVELRRHLARVAEWVRAMERAAADLDGATAFAPLVGRIAAGFPEAAEQEPDVDWVSFPAPWARGEICFALRVVGDSMVRAGILEDDVAIVRRQESAVDGDIVAATVAGETTLKRLVTEQGRRVLAAENDAYRAIELDEDARIHGVVVGLLRAIRASDAPRKER